MKLVHSSLALCVLGTALIGCGPASDEPAPNEDTSQTQEPLSIFDNVPPSVKTFASSAKEVAGLIGGVKEGLAVAQVLGELFGFLDAKPDPFATLTKELNTGLLALSWQKTLAHVDLARSYTNNAMTSLRAQSLPFDPNSAPGALIDSNSIMATTLLGVNPLGEPNLQNSGFMRIQVEAATDGPWKQVITTRPGTTRDVANPSSLLVYDWRLGLPVLMDTVAKRLAAIAGSDPGFASAAHQHELLDMRRALKAHHDEITGRGLQCNFRFVASPYAPITMPNFPPVVDTVSGRNGTVHIARKAQVACADIYTGTSWFDEWAWPDSDGPCTKCVTSGGRLPTTTCSLDNACVAAIRDPAIARVNNAMDTFRRSVLKTMPVFELRSMIDALYYYANPALDLTRYFGQIPLAIQPPHLCLDTGGPVNASWTGTPVKVGSCNYSNEQWWEYDRKTGVIRNPAYGVCLEVQPYSDILQDQNYPGVPAVASGCASPPPTRQRWSYDPESQVIRSAEGTVLDVKNSVFQPGTPVWLWDSNGSAAQRWKADQQFSLQVSAPTSCGELKPGEGLRSGEAAGSCDGRFRLWLQTNGNAILQQSITYNPPPPPPSPGGTTVQLWQTDTTGLLGDTLVMQGDGNLVLYNWLGGAVWHSNTWNRPGASLKIQNDGNLVIYDTSNHYVWSSNTCCR